MTTSHCKKEALALPLLPEPPLPGVPNYSPNERAQLDQETGNYIEEGWQKFSDGRLAIPEIAAPKFVRQSHQGTHIRKMALETLLGRHFYVPQLTAITRAICKQSLICAQNNPRQGPTWPTGIQEIEATPCENLLMDFTEPPRVRGYLYMLVLVCTFQDRSRLSPPEQRKHEK